MRNIYLLPFICVLACSPRMQTQPTNNLPALPAFDKQGHRGCRGLMPENTIPAMLHALDIGVTTLELDVVLTKDLQVVLSHEPWMSHEITTKPRGGYVTQQEEKAFNIFRMTYEEVQQFDVGMKPHPRFPQQIKMAVTKPLLRTLFDTVAVYVRERNMPRPFFNIETKSLPHSDNVYHPTPDVFVDELMAVIREKKMEPWVTIQSFDFRTLQYLHKHYPEMRTAMLIEDNDGRTLQQQLEALGFVPAVYSPHYTLVTPGLVSACRTKGMKLIPWTVNKKEEMLRLRTMGVDGIITDYPNLF